MNRLRWSLVANALSFQNQVTQLHLMLDKTERTAQDIITKYDVEMQKLTDQVDVLWNSDLTCSRLICLG
jgi:hypothetical protein